MARIFYLFIFSNPDVKTSPKKFVSLLIKKCAKKCLCKNVGLYTRGNVIRNLLNLVKQLQKSNVHLFTKVTNVRFNVDFYWHQNQKAEFRCQKFNAIRSWKKKFAMCLKGQSVSGLIHHQAQNAEDCSHFNQKIYRYRSYWGRLFSWSRIWFYVRAWFHEFF